MYLSRGLVLNTGAISKLELQAPFNSNGTPKPLVFVGLNGSGKTDLLSIVADGLIEIAAQHFNNITPHRGQTRTFFRVLGGRNQRAGTTFALSALQFIEGSNKVHYLAKSGKVAPTALATEMKEFQPVAAWNEADNEKKVVIGSSDVATIFQSGVYAFFPSTRFEIPHWANVGMLDRDPDADFTLRFNERLSKPIVVQSAIQAIKPWIIDVMLDGALNLGHVLSATSLDALKTQSLQAHTSFALTYTNINQIISAILGRPSLRFARTNRSFGANRICIVDGNNIEIPSLDNLSAGQSTLLAIFGTIARYGDIGSPGALLDQITGIAIIDEIDTHLHAELQHDALPALIKLFPRVQFIVSSHAPLFPLGMRKAFGDDGFTLIEMPSGMTVDAERFAEFGTSLDYFRATRAFEAAIRDKLTQNQRPIVLCEGETDPPYLRTAAGLLGFSALLEKVDFDWVGQKTMHGAQGGGRTHLDNALKFFKNNPQFLTKKVVLLYDSDAQKGDEQTDNLIVRSLPPNPDNKKILHGIENLLPEDAFEDRFYEIITSRKRDEEITRRTLRKTELCDFICKEARKAGHFEKFRAPLEQIQALLG